MTLKEKAKVYTHLKKASCTRIPGCTARMFGHHYEINSSLTEQKEDKQEETTAHTPSSDSCNQQTY